MQLVEGTHACVRLKLGKSTLRVAKFPFLAKRDSDASLTDKVAARRRIRDNKKRRLQVRARLVPQHRSGSVRGAPQAMTRNGGSPDAHVSLHSSRPKPGREATSTLFHVTRGMAKMPKL